MEITGVDTLIMVPFDGRPSVAAFVHGMRRLWPSALIGFDDGKGTTATDLADATSFPAHGELTFARDGAMDEHWEKGGYAPMSDGSGPVALFYEIHRSLVVEVDVAGDGGLDDGPLSGWTEVELAMPEATAFTLVTHAAPIEDAFCATILTLLRESLGYRGAVTE
ncbi:hypothetical protein [Micromonospora sp. M61]|uniref:hypothetical protein n=1 Tax=Micromonospora sp. M61 TaxID=2824890 RepID=UPI001B37FB0A|nr:hypothetical protein [Micromonospora sp. M61]MBQ0981680.1 hypothetical protein [Micromonospora sp. M61]